MNWVAAWLVAADDVESGSIPGARPPEWAKARPRDKSAKGTNDADDAPVVD
jgi:hypothetical protein